MSDFKTNIDTGRNPDKDWIAVQRIEKIREDEEEELANEAKKRNPEALLIAGFFSFLKKIFVFLTANRRRGQAILIDNIAGLIQYLSSLKSALSKLATEDQSYNPEFIQELSDAWHTLIEATSTFEWMVRKNAQEIAKVKFFIEEVRNFPPGEEHSLGFYLTQFAGREWLPFPFMDLLYSLHEAYQTDKVKSQLNVWILHLDSIIKGLASKPE